MFRLTYKDKYNPTQTNVAIFNDISDVGRVMLELTDSEKEANAVIEWCNNAKFGSKRTRKFKYILECVSEQQLNKPIRQRAKTNIWHIQYSDLGNRKTDTNYIVRYIHSDTHYKIEPIYEDNSYQKISAYKVISDRGQLISTVTGNGYVKGNLTNAKRIAEQSWLRQRDKE